MNNTTSININAIAASEREALIARSIEHLKKELQTIDDENDLSYDELKCIINGFGFRI
jgi:uncharacterized protein (UPF0335 family)